MAVSRGIGSILFSIIGIVLVVIATVLIFNLVSSGPPVKGLIYKSIELRQATNPVERADLITEMDKLVSKAKKAEIREQWDRMMNCLTSACPDEAFLDMVLVTVASFQEEIEESALLINIIATAKYWDNPDNLLEFSKALSIANEQIGELDDRKAQKIWEDIVECNNVCPEKDDLYFNVIAEIAR